MPTLTLRIALLLALTAAWVALDATASHAQSPETYRRLTTEWLGDGMCLDIVNDGANNNRLQLAKCGDVSGQHWKITKTKGGYVRLTTEWRGDGMCLDIVNDGVNNNQLQLARCGDFSGQRWKIASNGSPSPSRPAPPTPARACDGVDLAALGYTANPHAQPPPFGGTIFVSPNIITKAHPTAYRGATYAGVQTRRMFDRRTDRFDRVQAHIFHARLGANTTIEVQVNAEFTKAEAEAQRDRYLPAIGRLPAFLLADVDTVWIHKGTHGFGGGNRNLLIHTGQGERYIQDGILEETFVHEGTHTSMDARYAADPRWRCAQALDKTAVSPYAADHPSREDLAETLLLYLALRHRPDALSPAQRQRLTRAIPNRLRFLDRLKLSMTPVQ